jgi:hypothetical protein
MVFVEYLVNLEQILVFAKTSELNLCDLKQFRIIKILEQKRNQDFLVLKCSISGGQEDFVPTKKEEFDEFESISNLNCFKCNANLVQIDCLKHIRLPSDHWYELIECFSCHNEDYHTTLKGQKDGIIIGRKDVLMYSQTHFVFMHENIVPDSITFTETEVRF